MQHFFCRLKLFSNFEGFLLENYSLDDMDNKSKKTLAIVLSTIAILALLPVIIGFFMPRDRQVMKGIVVDQMYFMVLGNITNHWEEPSWRSNLDTMIQREAIDGQDCWVEYYTNGDSIKMLTQTSGEFDYVRRMIRPDGRELLRNITLADVEGKTAVRMIEEDSEGDPLKRFMRIFHDPVAERMEQYLSDLKERAIKQNEEMSEDGFFGF